MLAGKAWDWCHSANESPSLPSRNIHACSFPWHSTTLFWTNPTILTDDSLVFASECMLRCSKVPELFHPGGSNRGVSKSVSSSVVLERGGAVDHGCLQCKGLVYIYSNSRHSTSIIKAGFFFFCLASISLMGLSWWVGGGSCHRQHYRTTPNLYFLL